MVFSARHTTGRCATRLIVLGPPLPTRAIPVFIMCVNFSTQPHTCTADTTRVRVPLTALAAAETGHNALARDSQTQHNHPACKCDTVALTEHACTAPEAHDASHNHTQHIAV